MDLQFTSGDMVVVTGASRGIGAAVVKGFAAEGVVDLHVVSRDSEALKSLAADVFEEFGVEVLQHAMDLADAAQRRELVDTLNHADVLVNNAGAIPAGTLNGADLESWRSAWDLKVWGYIDLTRYAVASMTERGSGVVVNMIGASGERPDASYVAGSAGNAALMAFTRTVGAYSLDKGVRVVGVNPGPVETERLSSALRERAAALLGDEEKWRDLTAGYPGARIARPAEVADLTVFLASRRASYISGTIVALDGGMTWRGTIL